MREIKFRVRCAETNKVIGCEMFNCALNSGYAYYLESEKYEDGEGGFDYPCHSEYSERPMPSVSGFDRVIREQYTGLKDKNGIEIYEGDTVFSEDFDKPQVAVFLNGQWLVHTPGVGDWEPLADVALREVYGHSDYDGRFLEHTVEVIGNIYENPELLEN